MEQLTESVRRLKTGAADALRGMLRESMLPQSLLSAAAALLLALYRPREGIAPFGTGCAAGVWYAGISPYFACLAAAVGYAVRGCPDHAVCSLLLLIMTAVCERRFSVGRINRLLLAFGLEFTVLTVSCLIGKSPILYALGGACVSTLCAVVLGHGLCGTEQLTGTRQLTDSEILTMAASAGLIALCFGRTSLWGQSPALIFAGVCTLLAARRLGLASVAFAVAIGAGRVSATGGDMHFIAVIAACSLAASSLRAFGKWAVLAGFAGIDLAFLLFIRGTGIFSPVEAAAACLIYAVLPARLYMPREREPERGRAASPLPVETQRNALQYRVGDIACVLSELGRVFGGSDGRMLSFISGALMSCVSRGKAGAERFRVESAAASVKKPRSEKSGDSSVIKALDGGVLLCISDGMGSGEAASRESREALGMLCDLLTVGFDMQAAAECVNRLLIKRSGQDMYATLDALLINKATGTASVLKLGAPPTYVLRGGRLYSLYAENLPVGIIAGGEQAARSITLKRGDTVIMMSDGAGEALGSGLTAELTDRLTENIDTESAARGILDAAAAGGYEDDMTVIVARIE